MGTILIRLAALLVVWTVFSSAIAWAFIGPLALLNSQRAEAASNGKAAAPGESSDVRIIVLDDSDSDYKNPPFEDTVHLRNSKGKAMKTLSGFNICQTVGGCRAVSASDDGASFVVCENVANRLCAYETGTGKQIWSLPGGFTTAVMSGPWTYALTSAGTIYGDSLLAIDGTGTVTNQAKVGGFDIAIDPAHRVLWLVGADIKKCDLNLQVLTTVDPIAWCAVSVDVGADGSAWVAEREHPDVQGSTNRLLNISPDGALLQTIPLANMTPLCVRVDGSSGRVWVTGLVLGKALVWRHLFRWPPLWVTEGKRLGTRTHQYSVQGELLVKIKHGGESLDLDRSDGSVWIAGESKLLHYSRGGKRLGTCGGVSAGDKWITIVPQGRKSDR
jgi:hypothetical protein